MSIRLNQIADHYLLRGLFCKETGLWEGKMGMSIFYFLLSRHSSNYWYEEFASELLENVCNNLSLHTPITFSTGLCGIGWGIEFLKQERFIQGNTDEILLEIDKQVMERDVRRITDDSLQTGLGGITAYIRSRQDSRRSTDTYQPFEADYLQDLNKRCQQLNIHWQSKDFQVSNIWQKTLQAFSKSESLTWQKGLTVLYNNHDERANK